MFKKFGSALKYFIVIVLTLIIAWTSFYFIFLKNLRFAKLLEIDWLVNHMFYSEYDKDAVEDGIFDGYMDALDDKYAAYYNSDEASEKSDNEKGSMLGLGMTVSRYPDSELIYVIHSYEGGPAQKAGIQKGDIITYVNGESVQEIGYSESYNKLSGENGSTVDLKFLRNGESVECTAQFESCDIQSVYSTVFQNIGYIQITTFNNATPEQFINAINKLEAENVTGFIFDIRNNGGGTVDSVCEILDCILPEGPIMSVKYVNGDTKVSKTSDAEEITLPMTVLVNSHTASASELFSASIRDYNKGILIGEKTYGKGVMQQTFKLVDGSAIKFTVGEYFSKSMTVYDKVGIEPDIKIELNENQNKWFYQLDTDDDPCITAAINWLNENK